MSTDTIRWNPKPMTSIIKNREIVADDWHWLRAEGDAALPDVTALPPGKLLVPLAYWQSAGVALRAGRGREQLGVWLAPDDEPAQLAADFDSISLIGIDFPIFRDGRGYSSARLLRDRYGWQGELRALGDVLRDQLLYMSRCGFDAFAVRADKDIADALKAFDELPVRYQGAWDDSRPLFLRREPAPGAANAASVGDQA